MYNTINRYGQQIQGRREYSNIVPICCIRFQKSNDMFGLWFVGFYCGIFVRQQHRFLREQQQLLRQHQLLCHQQQFFRQQILWLQRLYLAALHLEKLILCHQWFYLTGSWFVGWFFGCFLGLFRLKIVIACFWQIERPISVLKGFATFEQPRMQRNNTPTWSCSTRCKRITQVVSRLPQLLVQTCCFGLFGVQLFSSLTFVHPVLVSANRNNNYRNLLV